MKLGSIPDPFSGEKLADIYPRIAPFVEQTPRLGRLHYFPGRHLTDINLGREQKVRTDRLALRGRAVQPGVVSGLELSWRQLSGTVEFALRPGQALTAAGIDLVVDRTVEFSYEHLRLYDPALNRLADLPLGLDDNAPTAAHVAVLVLQPGFVDDADLPLAAQDDHGTDFTPCPRVPEDEVYYKTTSTDAARLFLYPLSADTTAGALLQNLVAWTIFDDEAAGHPLPWHALGVPLAVIGFNNALVPEWIDRHAVVRPAGKPRRRVLIQPTFDARVWHARFDQFCAQLSLLENPLPAAALCQFLPPIGLLPKTYLALTKRAGTATTPPAWLATQSFFPAGYTIDISVIPLEQVDALIADTVSLQPYDLSHVDAVRLLLPVSQQWFDPALLTIEVIDPQFDQHLAQYRATRGDWLARRYDLAQRRRTLELSAGFPPTQYPAAPGDPDPERLESPEEPIGAPPGEPLQYGVTRSVSAGALAYNSEILAALRADAGKFLKIFTAEDIEEFESLFAACGLTPEQTKAAFGATKPPTWLARINVEGKDTTLDERERNELRRELLAYLKKQTEVQLTEAAKVDSASIQELITYFETQAAEADELVDAGFLKARTDVFRLGTLLSNNSLATKFVASPSLANIIDRKPAKSDTSGVNLYASQLLANFAPSAIGAASSIAANTADKIAVRSISAAAGTRAAPAAATAATARVSGATEFISNLNKTNSKLLENRTTFDSVSRKLTGDEKKAFELLRASAEELTSANTLIQLEGIAAIGTFADTFVANFSDLSQKQIRAIPLDRLQPALAPTVRQEIHDGRLEIFERLTRLDISLADLTTDFVDAPGTPVRPATPLKITRIRFQTLISRRRFDTLSVLQQTSATTTAINDADESKHFSTGVSYADMALSALRAVETRIKDYRVFVERCRSALRQTQAFIQQIATALIPVDVEIDESRQDVAVALALKAEEQARLDGINAHRDKVLAEHVEFLVFHRPRAVRLNTDVPSRRLEPALAGEPVIECLRENPAPPPDLAALRDIFRASPSKWFRYALRWLQKVDRWEHLHSLLVHASRTPLLALDVAPAITAGRYTQTLTKVFQARHASAQKAIAAAPAIEIASLVSLSWLDLQQRAERQLTLGQLIASGPAPLARAAAGELENIFAVATCLHENFSRVPGLLRLDWAEKFGQFDNVNVDFRDLSRLPGWPRIDFTLRREMQIHADWLFGRIDQAQPDALDLINDLVRIALLLASHAPVDQLIVGHPVENEVTPRPGGLLNLKVDPLRIRRGMDVIYKVSETQTLRAVVEDISANHVSARILEAPSVNGTPLKLTSASTLYFR